MLGRYIVTQSIGWIGPTAVIDVEASNVDIDLNGFALSNQGGPAILVTLGHGNVTIHGGTLISDTMGIDIMGNFNYAVEDVTILAQGSFPSFIGIRVTNGRNLAVRRASVNGGAPAILLSDVEQAIIEDCSVRNMSASRRGGATAQRHDGGLTP